MRKAILLVAGAGMALGLVGCSSKDDRTVKVTLSEFGIKLDDATVPAGKVKFELKNIGGLEHEFVVFKVDSVADVPKLPTGEANEEGIPEAGHMGEMEHAPAGKTTDFELDLQPGNYVALCNLIETNGVAHFDKGMSTTFTVT